MEETEKSRRQLKIDARKEALRKQQEKDSMNLKGNAIRVGAKEDPSSIKVLGQEWYVISFVAPVGARQRSKYLQIKFRGAFATDVEAKAHAKKVHDEDPDFDIHIFKAGAWIQVPPPVEHYKEVPMTYNQDVIDKVMDGYYAQIRQAKKDVSLRVRDAKRKAEKKRKEKGLPAPNPDRPAPPE